MDNNEKRLAKIRAIRETLSRPELALPRGFWSWLVRRDMRKALNILEREATNENPSKKVPSKIRYPDIPVYAYLNRYLRRTDLEVEDIRLMAKTLEEAFMLRPEALLNTDIVEDTLNHCATIRKKVEPDFGYSGPISEIDILCGAYLDSLIMCPATGHVFLADSFDIACMREYIVPGRYKAELGTCLDTSGKVVGHIDPESGVCSGNTELTIQQNSADVFIRALVTQLKPKVISVGNINLELDLHELQLPEGQTALQLGDVFESLIRFVEIHDLYLIEPYLK